MLEEFTLEERIEKFTSGVWGTSSLREKAELTIGKDEWLRAMSVSPTNEMIGIPLEFCAAWATKQDWPLSYADAVMVNVAWWQQLLEWRKAGGK